MIDDVWNLIPSRTGKRSDNGQVLPGVILFLALLTFLAFGLIKNLDRYARVISENERKALKESENLFHTHVALNGVVLNNLKLLQEFDQLLKVLNSTLTQSMSIAATTLLWEKMLPIPRPHDVFRSLANESRNVINLAFHISEKNREILKFSATNSSVKLNFLTVGQSLCQLPCVRETQAQLSGYNCKSSSFFIDTCTVTALHLPTIPLHLKSLPLRLVFPDELWSSPGFIFISKSTTLQTGESQSSSMISALVHPALCKTEATRFAIPCLEKLPSGHSMSIQHRLSLLPQWSVAFEELAQ